MYIIILAYFKNYGSKQSISSEAHDGKEKLIIWGNLTTWYFEIEFDIITKVILKWGLWKNLDVEVKI